MSTNEMETSSDDETFDLETSLEQHAATIQRAKRDMLARIDEADRQAREQWRRTLLEIQIDTERQVEVFVKALEVRARESANAATGTLTLELDHNARLRKQIR